MSVARKILWNTIAQIMGKAVLAVIGFITVKVITNYLGEVAGYGNYTAVYDFIALFGIVSDMGLYTIAVREMSRDEKQVDKIIGNVLTMRTVLAVGIMLVAFITSFFYARSDTNIMFPLAAAISATASVFMLLTGTISTVLQVNYKMQYNAFASVIGKITTLSYMLFVIFFWHPSDVQNGFYQLLVAGIIGNIIMLGVTFSFARRYAHIRYRFDKDFIVGVIKNSLPYGIALILNSLYFRIGSIMLYPIAGPEQSGIYGLPMRILESIAIVPLYFMNSVLPTLTKTIKEKTEAYKKVIQYSFDALVMGGMAMAFGVSAIAYQVIYLLSTPDYLTRASEGYYGSDAALQIVIFALAFSFMNTLFGYILVACNRQAKLLYVNGTGAVVAIVSNFLLIPWIGARGAAITDVMVEFCVALAAYIIAKKYLDFSVSLKSGAKAVFSGVLMAVVLYLLKDALVFWLQDLGSFMGLSLRTGHYIAASLLILIPLGAAIYIGSLFATRAVTKDMIRMLKKGEPEAPPIAPDVA